MRSRRLAAWGAAALAGVAVLTGCGPQPANKFVVSDSDDVVIKVPSSWTVVRSGPATGSDGQPSTDGSWIGVFDGSAKPNLQHAKAASATQPIAIAQSVVVTKEEAASLTDDALRDAVMPVSAKARNDPTQMAGLPVSEFKLLLDEPVRTKTATGVHVTYSWKIKENVEVFDQVTVVTAKKDKVHLFFVHCQQACYDTQRAAINEAVRSFTVKVP